MRPDRRGKFKKEDQKKEPVSKFKTPIRKAEVAKPKNEEPESIAEDMRLNKFIAHAGICSRRDADTIIQEGRIKVNKKVITELGYKVKSGDQVFLDNTLISVQKFVYLLLNKPKDFITTMEDTHNRKTVMDLVSAACPERVFPVGRLDRNTTGLLIFTNDGDLADKLSHPSSQVKKVYEVTLNKPIEEEHFLAIKKGIKLEDGEVKVSNIAIISDDQQMLGLEIHIGKNRIVRRIFEHFGYEVERLDRTIYAGLTKKAIPRGKFRFLNSKEINVLKNLTDFKKGR